MSWFDYKTCGDSCNLLSWGELKELLRKEQKRLKKKKEVSNEKTKS